jgi:DNA-binding XRE family transcriptional regulator/uncharacterized phage-associated protein
MNTAKTLQQLRGRVGVSQADVAAAIGVARATYASLEADRRPLNLVEAKKLSSYFGIQLEDLINGDIDGASLVEEPVAEYSRQAAEEITPREIDPRFQPEKFRQVFLYILNKVGARPNIGETVLYKLLYFIDFDYYEKTGHSITGLKYIHNKFGPSPVADFRSLVNDMQANKELEIVETKYFSKTQRKYLPNKRAKLDDLVSGGELQHIDEELERLGYKTAAELSEMSHMDTPWIVAKQGQPIDYRDTFYRTSATAVTEPEDEL